MRVQVASPDYDALIFYDDHESDGTITRTLAMRLPQGQTFEGEISAKRRLMIEESK